MKRTFAMTAALVIALCVAPLGGFAVAQSSHSPRQTIARLHARIDRLRTRVDRLRAENERLRHPSPPAQSQDTATITYHIPATTATNGFQCPEITNTHQEPVSTLWAMPSFMNLLRGSTQIVISRADGSTTTYAYDQADPPFDPCKTPYVAKK